MTVIKVLTPSHFSKAPGCPATASWCLCLLLVNHVEFGVIDPLINTLSLPAESLPDSDRVSHRSTSTV